MEVISIDGTEYAKASQLAKKFKYTSDYIGQLCRSGKVAAKLVGRTWYVNEDSLIGHKTNRYTKSPQDEKTIKDKLQLGKTRTDVPSSLRGKTLRSVKSYQAQNNPSYLKRIVWQPAKYESDVSDLLPKISSANKAVSIDVNLAESVKLKVAEGFKLTKLKADPLPEVSLKGRLKVGSIETDYSDESENIDENIAISGESKENLPEDESLIKVAAGNKDSLKVRINKTPDREKVLRKKTTLPAYTYPVEVKMDETKQFTPEKEIKPPVFAPKSISRRVDETSTVERGKSRLSTETVIVSLSIIVGLFLMTVTVLLESSVTVTQSSFEQSYQLKL